MKKFKSKFRGKYTIVMGNYHRKYEEYNPKKMAMVKKYEPLKQGEKK